MARHASSLPVLLAVDVGNSTADFGLFRGHRLARSWKLDVRTLGRPNALHRVLASRPTPDAVAISSVNPPVSREIAFRVKQELGLRPLWVGRDLPITMPLRTRSRAVGSDRLCSAIGAFERVRGACIVVGCGTAITVDAVSGKGEFLGGAIACGLSLAARALHDGTALLPQITPRAPRQVIGRDTVAAMQSGIVLGTAGAVEHLVARVRKELGEPATVFATGGNAEALGKLVSCFDIIALGLSLEGIRALYQQYAERARHVERPK